MKRAVLAASSLAAVAALAQSPSGVPVPSPNRLSAAQATAPSRAGDPSISAGSRNAPLLVVDSTGKASGRYESGGTVVFMVNGKATRLLSLSADCSTPECPAVRSSAFVFPDIQEVVNNFGAVYYLSSDCSGSPYMAASDIDITQSAIAIKEADGSFYLYVTDVSGPFSNLTFQSQFVNGQCSAVNTSFGAHAVTAVVPASSFGIAPFHLE